MKRKIFLISLIFLTLIFFVSCSSEENISNKKNIVNFYNWGDYIDPDILADFTKETGIKVIESHFDSNETMYAKISGGGTSYDVTIPSDYMIEKLIQEDMLEKFDINNIPNFKHIDDKFKNMAHDKNNEYSVPYMWGTLGILYNSELVTEEVNSWDILWDEKYSKEIFMYDSVRDTLGVSLKRLGYSLNSIDKLQLEQARDELIKQKPIVQAYIGDTVKEKMIGNEGLFAVVYSGDAMYCLENNPNLAYAIPKEGSNVWFDGMVILKNSPNKENAEILINYLSRPEIAGKNSEYIGYSTANKSALEFIDEEMTSNPIYWPTDEEFERCEVFKFLGDDAIKLYDIMWTEVLAS